jgi:hypothetical protein
MPQENMKNVAIHHRVANQATRTTNGMYVTRLTPAITRHLVLQVLASINQKCQHTTHYVSHRKQKSIHTSFNLRVIDNDPLTLLALLVQRPRIRHTKHTSNPPGREQDESHEE